MSMSADQIALARQYLADPGTSAVQSIQIENAVGGTFTISYSGQTTTDLDFNAGSNAIQNALCALSNIGVGSLTANEAAGAPGSTFYAVYFANELGNIAVPMLTVDTSNLIGTGVLATVSLVTAGGTKAFSDDELNALYADAQSSFYLAICYGFRVLQSNAAKFNRYTAGQTQEFKEQIFDHLEALAAKYEEWARSTGQVLFASMVPEPPRLRAVPWQTGSPATSLVYGSPYGPRRRNGWGGWS